MSTQKQPKSILKKSTPSIQPQILTPPQQSSEQHPTEERVVWDEANLQLNEEERIAAGPRMKIDEPKTPYHESLHPDDVDLLDDFSLGGPAIVSATTTTTQSNQPQTTTMGDNKEQNESLSHIAHKNMIQNATLITTNLQDDDDESSEEEDDRYIGLSNEERDEEIAKHKKFEEMRKQHYNMKADMFKKASNPLSMRMNDSDEDDDESDSDYKDE